MEAVEKKKAITGALFAALVGVPVLAAQSGMIHIAPASAPAAVVPDAPQAPTPAEQKAAAERAEQIASGEHCLSGWDDSFPALKNAVKGQLRNPRSFEHVETVRSPVDSKGTFGLIMTYRAENGFGGMNVEAIGVEVNAQTCRFKPASNASLAKRLRAKPS